MKNLPFVILGAGGHGRVVAEALRSAGRQVAAFLDSDHARHGEKIDGVLVVGTDEKLADFPPTRYHVAIGVGSVKDTRRRRSVHDAAAKAGASLPPVTAASAVIAASARLGDGCQILTQAVVHPGAILGAGSVINTSAVIEHDCILGEHTFVGPGAILCGGVNIGQGTFIGAGAVILPGLKVGANALVAAGVVVRKSIPDGGKELGRAARRGAKP